MRIVFEDTKQDFTVDFAPSLGIRLLDLIASGLGLLLLAPFFLVFGILIKVTSRGPVFYKAERVGQAERLFKLYKFRSMVQDADQKGPGVTVKNDSRVTPVGRFLRRTKLDELPQLINVIRGQIGLVGPRPEDPRYVTLYTPQQRAVLAVRPGMTSPASLYYRKEESLLDEDNWEKIYKDQILPHKLALDLAYLRQRTVWTDLRLILQTVIALINGRECLNSILKLRNRHFFMLDILVLLFIPALALTLRLDGLTWWPAVLPALVLYTIVSSLISVPIFLRARLYNRYWRYASVNDLLRVLIAVGLSTTILTVLFGGAHTILQLYGLAIYRTVPLIAGLLTGLAVGGSRLGMRALHHWHRRHYLIVGGRRALVVGAGECGTMVVREIRANPQLNMEPVAFVDDDPAKIGTQIQSLPVLGSSEDIPTLVDRCQIRRIIVAIPSAPLKRQREILAVSRLTGVTTYNFPGVYELLAGHKTISRLPKVDINHLLRREPVVTDRAEVVEAMNGMKVLVTGAGGSIGNELCRQIARLNPKEIILLGHGENSIFEINLDLQLSFPSLTTHPVIVDVRDQRQIDRIMDDYRPDVVFHAAAHKHVPFMETNVEEAITNNILGTKNVLQAAEQYNIERFILVSTDKAVNPTSIMGATKRLAELLVIAAAWRSKRAYIAVRFGNVLGSRGSVIPVFQQQIAAGGPLTVTHPDMYRYFMTIPEAVQLMLQATVLGKGGDVFVLDMGQPVRILDLASDLIKLSGLKPGQDIEIVFSGIRPGEKLNEELFVVGEDYRRTKHPKIFTATQESIIEPEALEALVLELINLATQIHPQTTAEQMRVLLLEVCYYIDQYQLQPQQTSLAKPIITPKTAPPHGSLQQRPSASPA